jgi:elongation factor Ts
VLVEVLCETDFVARTSEFKALAHDIALHIAAMNPLYIRKEDIPQEVIEAERGIVENPDKHFADVSLLTQSFVKNADKTVGEVLAEAAGKFGENIRIGRFIRFAM